MCLELIRIVDVHPSDYSRESLEYSKQHILQKWSQ